MKWLGCPIENENSSLPTCSWFRISKSKDGHHASGRHGSERDIEKPVLVLIVTDGVPDDKDRVTETIEKYCAAAARSKYGKYSLAFSFTQIGNSKSAAKWLADLDVDGVIGDYVDCTSRLEIEQQECAAKGITLTPMMWMVKVLVGAINPHYDQMDDAGAAATASGCHNNPFIAPPGYAPPGYQPIVTMDASQPPVHVVGTVRPSPAMMSHYNAGP